MLKGRVALVTGAARGIGFAIARRLAEAGAAVVVNDVDPAATEAAVAELAGLGVGAVGCPADVTAPDTPDRLVAAAVDAFGTLDVVVNNAGYGTYAPVLEMSDAKWTPMLDTLLTAPFRILRAAGPLLTRPADHVRKVVTVSSVAGVAGSPGSASYAAAKAGVHGLTATLAKEWGRYGVTVNAVAPGLIRTRLTEGRADGVETIDVGGRRTELVDIPLQKLESHIPVGRIGTPEDVAGAVYLLCSPDADYITGQTLVVSGGWLP
ncbi:SDR family NAD(P)-dependent oxidoreductase [Pseudonocardia lutea]|uniref:SDR family NAD(P)-dependent oxidoreductase n=1 Tax=Pseudonocardia lutea TaxID=2172015 RepID=A0ABW1IDY5_9PSEU